MFDSVALMPTCSTVSVDCAGPVAGWLLVAALVAWATIWLLQPFAARWGLVDHPSHARKDHGHSIPVTGGLGIFFGLVLSPLFFFPTDNPALLGFLAGAGLLMVVGILDDLYDLHWSIRILSQAVAALIMVKLGGVRVEQLGPAFGLDSLALGGLSLPFTVFATVGLINAINMIDGVDGLCGSLVACACLMLAGAAVYAGNLPMAMMALALVGALLGFLAHNFALPWRPRARVFMGNGGSALLGFCIAWISFSLTQNPGHPVSPVLALWLIPIPVLDCLVLIVRRYRAGRSPFAAGRDHVHHFMRDAGFSSASLVLALSALSLVTGLLAALLLLADVPRPALLLGFFIVLGLWFWLSRSPARAVALFAGLRTMVLPASAQLQPTPAPHSSRDKDHPQNAKRRDAA
ncbi:MraY family glycosyltransferase [Stenotrophomonas koreensis]|uniref:MraY family glycosyltransferase n=1 Tax=Stenotrophomonas koreensis TaxID=266128 RepID=UPI000A53D857|nr:MraY family glycosyltransferase [Stenotrophomonas koreensis]